MGKCVNDLCVANKAIDGDLKTFVNINPTGKTAGWLKIELMRTARIRKILLYLSHDEQKRGYLTKLQIDSRRHDIWMDTWTICKRRFSAVGSIAPYVVKCDIATPAKYIRIFSYLKTGVSVFEVKVIEEEEGKNRLTESIP